MKEQKIILWLSTAEMVRWYYKNTDMSLLAIARRYNISEGKADNMLRGKYPKSIINFLKAKGITRGDLQRMRRRDHVGGNHSWSPHAG